MRASTPRNQLVVIGRRNKGLCQSCSDEVKIYTHIKEAVAVADARQKVIDQFVLDDSAEIHDRLSKLTGPFRTTIKNLKTASYVIILYGI